MMGALNSEWSACAKLAGNLHREEMLYATYGICCRVSRLLDDVGGTHV